MERPIGSRSGLIVEVCISGGLNAKKSPEEICTALRGYQRGEASEVLQACVRSGEIDKNNFSEGAEHIAFACSLPSEEQRINYLRLVYEYLGTDLRRHLRNFLATPEDLVPSVENSTVVEEVEEDDLSSSQSEHETAVAHNDFHYQPSSIDKPSTGLLQPVLPVSQPTPVVPMPPPSAEVLRKMSGDEYVQRMNSSLFSLQYGNQDMQVLYPDWSSLIQHVGGHFYLVLPTSRLKLPNGYQLIVHCVMDNQFFIEKIPPMGCYGGTYRRWGGHEVWVRVLPAWPGRNFEYRINARLGNNGIITTHFSMRLVVGLDYKVYRAP
jgi:hypothetical protein